MRLKRSTTENGITLVALVITIVILIILATVTLNVAFGDDGLIQKAQEAKNLTEEAVKKEQEELNCIISEYTNIIVEEPGINTNTTIDPEPEEPEQSEVEIAKELGTIFEKKTIIEDANKNKIMIPEGFKIAGGDEGSGVTVEQGIVIEDAFSEDENVRGSQYVWIPVGKFIKDDGTESNEIVLGRYTFLDDGTPQIQQSAFIQQGDELVANYTTPKVLESYYSELAAYQAGVASSAYNLEAWMNSVKANGGYYIGRYEASFASGTNISNYKCASKKSRGYSKDSMLYNSGTLWNFITQSDASKVSINTYKNTTNGVKSDLINSYAWDTAIVYIQACGNTNYANQVSKNTALADTGVNGDEVCKVNDLASNCCEWTTEYSYYTDDSFNYPCVNRGGDYSSQYCTAFRSYSAADHIRNYISFRLTLYIEI